MPKALRGVPEVDPDLRGQENPISPRSDKSIGFTYILCKHLRKLIVKIALFSLDTSMLH